MHNIIAAEVATRLGVNTSHVLLRSVTPASSTRRQLLFVSIAAYSTRCRQPFAAGVNTEIAKHGMEWHEITPHEAGTHVRKASLMVKCSMGAQRLVAIVF